MTWSQKDCILGRNATFKCSRQKHSGNLDFVKMAKVMLSSGNEEKKRKWTSF
jgi:hypothetical protein